MMDLYYKLVAQYPDNFKNCFDFSPPDGWDALVEKLVHDVIAVQPDIQIDQVKDKFGELRFYTGAITPEADKLVEAAELEAESTCMVCGKPGKQVVHRGWVSCLCSEHEPKENN